MTLRARLGLRLVIWGFRLLGCPTRDIALVRIPSGLKVAGIVKCDWAEEVFQARK